MLSLCEKTSLSVHVLKGKYFFPSAQEKNDNAGIFLEVLCCRLVLFLFLSQPWPFQSVTIIEVGESYDFYHKTLKYMWKLLFKFIWLKKKIISKTLSVPTFTQVLARGSLTFSSTYRHIKKIFFIFYTKSFCCFNQKH